MLTRVRRCSWIVAVLALVSTLAIAADGQDRRIEALERELAELRQLLSSDDDAPRIDEVERRMEILAVEIEKLKIGEQAPIADVARLGLGPAASKVYGVSRGVSIGGYGELLYENFDSKREDGSASGATDQLDLLRAVVYFGYKFDDRFLFNSEIEFEHASTEDDGEVSVEFAYLDYLWRDEINLRAGLVLLPMGLVNELHEPTTFLSSERPETERRILPSTWRENGVGLYGDLGPFSYRSYVVNGLDARGFAASGLRDGRQDGSKAKAQDFAWVGRLDYVATPGLLVGASGYLGKSGQDLVNLSGGSIDVGTSIVEGHLDWRWRGLRLRALGAQARVDDAAELNDASGLVGAQSVGETMTGQYFEAGYDLLARRGKAASLVPFARWESLDTQHAVPAGFTRDPASETTIYTLGLAYQPIPQLILKLDYQDRSDEARLGVSQFNAALGYVF